MNPLLLAQILAQVGTVGLPLVANLMRDINAGRTQTKVTPEDLEELSRLSAQTGADIYAKLGIKLPPAIPPAAPA